MRARKNRSLCSLVTAATLVTCSHSTPDTVQSPTDTAEQVAVARHPTPAGQVAVARHPTPAEQVAVARHPTLAEQHANTPNLGSSEPESPSSEPVTPEIVRTPPSRRLVLGGGVLIAGGAVTAIYGLAFIGAAIERSINPPQLPVIDDLSMPLGLFLAHVGGALITGGSFLVAGGRKLRKSPITPALAVAPGFLRLAVRLSF